MAWNSTRPALSLLNAASPSASDPGAKALKILDLSLSRMEDELRIDLATGPRDLEPGIRRASEICSKSFWTLRMGFLLSMGRA